MTNVDTYGSEGDAYRYTKKVLQSLPNSCFIESIYKEVAEKRGISSWTRAAYMDLRATFFRDGQCKIRFAPGAARIAFGELSLGTGDEELVEISNFRDMLRIISIAHCKDYTRHLVSKDGEKLTYQTMLAIYGTKATANWSWMKRKLRRMKYGERRYKIIELDSFETAKQYAEYTKPHTWCHLQYPDTFKHYAMVNSSNIYKGECGCGVNRIRLYLAVLPGFETMTEADEMYGESMLGIDIGPGGRLIHVNNRWNHAHDNIDERKGDNKYSEIELSMLLGGPFFEVCPPFTPTEERQSLVKMAKEVSEKNKVTLDKRMKLAKMVYNNHTRGKVGVRCTEVLDSRDNTVYKLKKYGKTRWMTEPLKYIPEGSKVVDLPHDILDRCPKEKFDMHVRIMTVIHTKDGAKVVWRPCDDPALEEYRNYVLANNFRRGGKTACISHVGIRSTRDDAMLMPSDHNRVIVSEPLVDLTKDFDAKRVVNPTYGLTALRVVYDIYVPLFEVNGMVFALHPAYNQYVEKMENGVRFPDLPKSGEIQDQFGKTEIVSAEDVTLDLETHRNSSAVTDWRGNDMDMVTEVWRRMLVIERFVCDAIFTRVTAEMIYDNYTASDVKEVMTTLRTIITRKSNKLMESNYASRWNSTTRAETAIDRTTNITVEYDPGENNEIIYTHDCFRNMYGDDAFYAAASAVANADARRYGKFMYGGYTQGSRELRPARGLLYMDMDAVARIITNSFMSNMSEYYALLGVIDISDNVPVGVPGVSGYIYTPRLEYSRIPVTKEEGILYDLGRRNIEGKDDQPIIRFDDGLTMYPSRMKPMLETDELRFPNISEAMERMAIGGFSLAEDFKDIDGHTLMTKDEAEVRSMFRTKYRNHLRKIMHLAETDEDADTTEKKETPKSRSRGVVIPRRLPDILAIPKICRSVMKDEKFGELFMVGSCAKIEKEAVDKLASAASECQNFSLVNKIGLAQHECVEDPSGRLRVSVSTDEDTGNMTVVADPVPNGGGYHGIFINLDKVNGYIVPLMVKRSSNETVSGNS